MRTIHIGAASLLLLASLLIAPLAFAEDNNGKADDKGRERQSLFSMPSFMMNFNVGTSSDAIKAQIKSLQDMLENMRKQREAFDDDRDKIASSTKAARETLREEMKGVREEIRQAQKDLKFERSLMRGMMGDDVRDLQELLAQDSSIFSSSFITGFFGPKTEEALRKFQKKFGIEAIGVFGPKTQAKLLSLFVGRELPPGIIKRLGLETSTTTPGQGFVTICHKPAGTSPQTLVIAVPALGAHLAHGDSAGVCPGSGNATTTPPVDTTAPVISAISASSIASTSANVVWTTNESATSKAWFGTSSPLTLGGSTSNVSNTTLVTSHTLSLSGLSASTTYQYVVESKDGAGNTATSSQQTFTTAQ